MYERVSIELYRREGAFEQMLLLEKKRREEEVERSVGSARSRGSAFRQFEKPLPS